jgi:hypothetical protein
MKKIILLGLTSILLFSCKPKQTAASTKVDNKSQVAIKGNWTLVDVSYPGSDYIKVNSFQLADSKCFEGSTWIFISNNDSGQMTLNNAACSEFSSPIKWYVNKDGQFVLKILNAGEKAKKVRDGYVLGLGARTADSFQLIDKINVGGKLTDVIYEFKRINQ